MPQKNSIKIYYENAFYHIYNRGVEKRNIFLDEDDYRAFLHLLKTSLSPPEPPGQGGTLSDKTAKRPRRKNFFGKIDLLCFCLMPNHYHLLLRQNSKMDATEFIRSISTAYSMYFNKKYERVGSLFQGVFKAVDVNDENYLLWVSRYIHKNPEDYRTHSFSSYDDYLGKRKTSWINTSLLHEYFKNHKTGKEKGYQEFVESEKETPIDFGYLSLEDEG